jgi:hypothetical protein
MEQVSERVHYYGNIMDVLVQHHPEYVSLAWGTMKLLVGVCVKQKTCESEPLFASLLANLVPYLP